jgi:hypothetical protein
VLSQLALRGYDANMTLGRTKGVDILVSDPSSSRMLRLEVKTNYRRSIRSAGGNSRLLGKFVSAWMMGRKHEQMKDPNLFYCFVNIIEDTKQFRFYIVPSAVVADYVRAQHQLWLNDQSSHSRETTVRTFRIGTREEKYPIPTPVDQDYEGQLGFVAGMNPLAAIQNDFDLLFSHQDCVRPRRDRTRQGRGALSRHEAPTPGY